MGLGVLGQFLLAGWQPDVRDRPHHAARGMNLFVVQGVRRDGGSFGDVVRGSMPYVFIMIGFVLVIIAAPRIVTFLPDSLAGW
jgi:C4-dicarboxylate transporter DctM subunit